MSYNDATIHVMQDGADFYVYSSRAMTNHLATYSAPIEVSDIDLDSAQRARDWFINRFSENKRITWEGE